MSAKQISLFQYSANANEVQHLLIGHSQAIQSVSSKRLKPAGIADHRQLLDTRPFTLFRQQRLGDLVLVLRFNEQKLADLRSGLALVACSSATLLWRTRFVPPLWQNRSIFR